MCRQQAHVGDGVLVAAQPADAGLGNHVPHDHVRVPRPRDEHRRGTVEVQRAHSALVAIKRHALLRGGRVRELPQPDGAIRVADSEGVAVSRELQRRHLRRDSSRSQLPHECAGLDVPDGDSLKCGRECQLARGVDCDVAAAGDDHAPAGILGVAQVGLDHSL